jgi:hypothetical protein
MFFYFKDEDFKGKMINILDIFLSKSDETYKLRDTLKNYRIPHRQRKSSCKLL